MEAAWEEQSFHHIMEYPEVYVERPRNPRNSYVRFEGFTAQTIKNAVSWDIGTQFLPHRRHITSPLQSPAD
jgi:hypothetical protein